jgi:hypothetical protein
MIPLGSQTLAGALDVPLARRGNGGLERLHEKPLERFLALGFSLLLGVTAGHLA